MTDYVDLERSVEPVLFMPLAFWTVLLFVPLFVLVNRTGLSKAWLLLLLLLPVGGVILAWVLAFKAWPRHEAEGVAQ